MSNLVRFNPFAELEALQKQFLGDDWLTPLRSGAIPSTDVYTENDKQLVIEAHLPNFDEKDITVSIDKGAVVIQAEKRQKEEDKDKRYMVRETSSSFYRRIVLPEQADTDNGSASLDNGVLKVTVPFRKLPAPKKIAINSNTKKALK